MIINIYKNIRYLIIIILLLFSCKSVVKQFYEDSTARFNSYFIANENIKKVQNIIYDAYKWNYDEIIPIISPLDSNNISQYSDLTNNAIEKASLLIQRHPESSLVMDSYILIGLSRLYNFEFKNAEITFKYVNTKSQNIKTSTLALIYLMRSYFENNKIQESLEVYNYLRKVEMNKKNKISFHLNAAFIFQNIKNYDEVIKNLNLIEEEVTNKNQQSKILFLIGQIYQEKGFKNEAYKYYRKCLKNNPSFELEFYTKLNLAKVTELTNSNDIKKIYKYFNKLLRDKKNENYLDKIFFEIGEFEYNQNKIDLAIINYNKSLKSSESSSDQKYLNYKKLAEINYNDFREYEISKLYYDSTLNNTNRENKEYKNLNERREILLGLVENLKLIEENDSLIQLSLLDRKEINKIVDNYISRLKKEEKKREKLDENFSFNDNQQEIIDENLSKNTWYFYNDVVMTRGRDEFKRIWGNRKLTDNWRISRKIKLIEMEETNIKNDESPISISSKENNSNEINRENLFKKIPFEETEKNNLKKQIEIAYFKVGKIYIQQLNEFQLGKNYFDKLLIEFNKSEYIPEVLYLLYLTTKEDENNIADIYKEKLLNDFPNNLFTKLIINPNYEQDQFAENTFLIGEYNSLFKKYENKDYDFVITKSNSIISNYSKNGLHEKFILLKALANGELHGNFIFQLNIKKILNNVTNNDIIQFSKELLKSSEEVNRDYIFSGIPEFNQHNNEEKFYLVFVVNKDDNLVSKISNEINNMIKDKNFNLYFINRFKYTKNETLIVVSNLNYEKYNILINDFELRYKEKIPILSKFVIAESNMKILFETKSHFEYLNFIKNEK
tara:strand:- start:1724 stop:4243 length:2520 start_codon:yes stop_codon:yes gene_type:complete